MIKRIGIQKKVNTRLPNLRFLSSLILCFAEGAKYRGKSMGMFLMAARTNYHELKVMQMYYLTVLHSGACGAKIKVLAGLHFFRIL